MTEKEIILDCINNSKPLPKSLQIKILKLTLKKVQKEGWDDGYGLCYNLKYIITGLISTDMPIYDSLRILIPFFNISNAVNPTYCIDSGYWWNRDQEGNAQRIKFLKRIIKELEGNKFKKFLSKFF